LSLGWSSYDLEVLREFQSNYGAIGQLMIIGCNMDNNPANAEQFAKNQGMTWTQAYLGDWNQSPVASMFGINGSSLCVLISPEGKVASGQLRGTALRAALSSAMSTE
jgi:hypothetical protein